MKYHIAYAIMLASFGYLSFTGIGLKAKAIGLLCLLVNALIFWR